MEPGFRVAVVAGGYVAAFLIASAAVAIRVANTNGPDVQAASGMYAFGDTLLVAPLFALAFFVCTILSPHRFPRVAFLAATAMEAGVSAYGGFIWFVPLFFHGR